MRIGVISDTHGLLRPEAVAALSDVDHILHAGDVGNIEVINILRKIAPVTAVRGNIDTNGDCSDLPPFEWIDFAGHSIYLLHDLKDLDLDPEAAGISMVVSGHSHRAGIERRGAIVYLNPGSAGPRRFSLPVTVATVEIAHGDMFHQIVEIVINERPSHSK